jgi:hypothetical protein
MDENLTLKFEDTFTISSVFLRLLQSHLHTHVYCSTIYNNQDAPLPTNGLRKCGIYTQWNFIQPQRRIKFCHLQVNRWYWRTGHK